MAQLSAAELRKYEWRAEVFIKKIKQKSPFEISGKKKVVLTMPKDGEKILRSGTNSQLSALQFTDTKGKTFKLKDFVKNSEFGGKGEGSGTAKEDAALSSLKDQINEAKIKDGSATIPVRVGNKTYDVFDAISTPGTPKSDFHLVDISGKEIVWISHKDGRTERDFQQWGGMSQRSEPAIYAHKESQKFLEDLKNLYPKGLPRATTIARKIKDIKLKMMAVYGNEYGGKNSRQNTTLMLQGEVKLSKKANSYQITAYHTHDNGDVMSGGYEPVFMAIYKGDRSDFNIAGTRVVISPAGCRKVTEYI